MLRSNEWRKPFEDKLSERKAHYRKAGENNMDIYLLERLHKLLHGPINVFDREGNLIHSFEEGVCQPGAPREFQGKGKEKSIY